jgi:Flp pilus assembly protein TadG
MMEKAGNIALSFAIISVPVLGAMGAGFDYVRAMNLHHEIQNNLDAALVAAVKDMEGKDDAAIRAQFTNWMAVDAEISGTYTLDASNIVIDKTNSGITATVTANVSTTFMRLLGHNNVPIAVKASVIAGDDPGSPPNKAAFSMYFVLDRSTSMREDTDEKYETLCYKSNGQSYKCNDVYSKMESLKLATVALLAQIAKQDPDSKLARTGAVSYDDEMQSPTPLAWGSAAVGTYINALQPSGTTNSGEAFEMAYKSLVITGLKSEEKEHENKNGNTAPSKYIVFMTDGANNVNGADSKTRTYCEKARTANIKVYTIAFMAPPQGQSLLRYCATTSDDYFEADGTAALVSAFESIGEQASKKLVRLTN